MGNSTSDVELNHIAHDENRFLVTKDEDFVNSFFLLAIILGLENHAFVEIDRDGLTTHE